LPGRPRQRRQSACVASTAGRLGPTHRTRLRLARECLCRAGLRTRPARQCQATPTLSRAWKRLPSARYRKWLSFCLSSREKSVPASLNRWPTSGSARFHSILAFPISSPNADSRCPACLASRSDRAMSATPPGRTSPTVTRWGAPPVLLRSGHMPQKPQARHRHRE